MTFVFAHMLNVMLHYGSLLIVEYIRTNGQCLVFGLCDGLGGKNCLIGPSSNPDARRERLGLTPD